jgi:hypothetical protein
MGWLARQYSDIKGNFKWALLAPIWAAITWAAQHLLNMIPHMPEWAVWAITLLGAAVLFVGMATYLGRSSRQNQSVAQAATNTLMASHGNFDATPYFQTAYVSSLRPELENNLRAAAAQNRPDDQEGFYRDLIVTGLPAFVYDLTWSGIFRSQILLLQELNRRALALAEARTFYDKAATENPIVYANYPFERWLNFMKANILVLQHPAGIVEITVRGRDFLKYLVHCGRSADDRRN